MTFQAASLSGLRVLDISRVYAGPSAAQVLADLGADVLKIERPGLGDDTRAMGPHFDGDGDAINRSAYFWAVNRGKQSVAIDLAKPEGAALVRQLAQDVDVLIENFKVGGLPGFGLGYDTLSALNPRLVYCSITGFGQNGPYRDQPGYDSLIQAMGGLMSLTGEADDRPGGGPQRVALPMIDVVTGLYATTAILAALTHRGITGMGQYIDLALLDVMVSSLSYIGVDYLQTGHIPPRVGTRNHVIHPCGIYQCADGQIMLMAGNNEQFANLCRVLDMPELAGDPRFGSSRSRIAHADLLDARLLDRLRTMQLADCVAALARANVPAGPINDLGAVFADPQVAARGDVVALHHPAVGRVRVPASPMRLSETPVRDDRPAPVLGEHTAAVLRDRLGLPPDTIDDLIARGIIA